MKYIELHSLWPCLRPFQVPQEVLICIRSWTLHWAQEKKPQLIAKFFFQASKLQSWTEASWEARHPAHIQEPKMDLSKKENIRLNSWKPSQLTSQCWDSGETCNGPYGPKLIATKTRNTKQRYILFSERVGREPTNKETWTGQKTRWSRVSVKWEEVEYPNNTVQASK